MWIRTREYANKGTSIDKKILQLLVLKESL